MSSSETDQQPLASVPAPSPPPDDATPPPPQDDAVTGGRSPYRPNRREAIWLAGGAALGVVLGAGGLAVSRRGGGVTRGDETLDAKQALEELVAGNERFAAGKPVRPDQSVDRRDAVAEGQHPFAAVLSCSDSRVPPEMVFDQGIGDLYTVRSAAQVVDDAVLGTLEYAVETLGVPLIVVLGHSQCGSVKAAITALEKATDGGEDGGEDGGDAHGSESEAGSEAGSASGSHDEGSDDSSHAIDESDGSSESDGSNESGSSGSEPSESEPSHEEEDGESGTQTLIDAITPAVHEAEDLGAEGGKLLPAAIDINVDRVVEDLKKSAIIIKAVKLRKVKIVGGTYSLKTGEVDWA